MNATKYCRGMIINNNIFSIILLRITKHGNIRYLTTNIVSQMYNKTFPLLTINPNLYFLFYIFKLLFTQFNPIVMCARSNVFHHAIKCTLRYHNNYNYRCCYYTLLLNLDTFVLWARHCYVHMCIPAKIDLLLALHL